MAKRVLVLCGNGVATSTVATKKIQEYLDGQKIQANVIQAKIGELASYADKVDVIVLMAMGAALPAGVNKPVMKGLPFITGVGQQQALEEIKKHLTA
ncbi:MAG TPA: PTS sugar transporter subunit IIB [Symbiobacteriaceae bacterium]|jgi:PTS system galactitol-specific IIB component|nr:PTS sugar transporter subunit IIB [Symbiobacteriaceae bacterium]